VAGAATSPRDGCGGSNTGAQASHEEADAIVVNTCAFIDEARAAEGGAARGVLTRRQAKQESIAAIMDAAGYKADGKARRVIVTGCLAQRYAGELASELPEVSARATPSVTLSHSLLCVLQVDLVVGFQDYPRLSGELHGALGKQPARTGASRVLVGSATVPFRPEWDRHALTPRHTAYLRVAEGCDHKCTFCAIPSFRGKFRSKPWEAVLDEARRLAASGVRELNLIAEDTNQYGMDFPKTGANAGRGLAELLHALAALPGVEWIRILYAYPSYFTDELIDAIATIPQVCKYIDIPLQHISNTTLLAMNRPPRQHTEALLHKLRDRIPGLALRSTFICGFPGEREEDHRELVNFCKTFRFERLGAFVFSEEEGTPAGAYPDQLPREVREARRDEIVQTQQRLQEKFAAKRVGSTISVLVDAYDEEEGVFVGRSQLEAPDVDPCVFLHDAGLPGVPPLAIGQMRTCRVDGASLYDLTGYPVA